MIADVAFDLPLRHALSYVVPEGLTLTPGQRVSAPVQGRPRAGVVVGLREASPAGLQLLHRPLDPVPVLGLGGLDLARWAAEEGLSSWGSTLAALLPPRPRAPLAEALAPPGPGRPVAKQPTAELWIGTDREQRLAARLASSRGSALVVAPDIETAAHWAARLEGARLDSGIPDGLRRAAWFAAARGRVPVAVGTRSALLVPLPPPATLVLLGEHDPAHKPPGPPRLHSRDLLLARAAREGSSLLLLSPTPSVESWWRAEQGDLRRRDEAPASWPEVVAADPRGILRHHPLTLPLTRALEDAARGGSRVALIVTRDTTALGCDECGSILRCSACGVALGVQRASRSLACRLCASRQPLPERCPACGGHRLTPVGWSMERVEASVRRRFPRLGVRRVGGPPADPDAAVLVGTPGLLRTLAPGQVGCVGFVALDALLRVPDFRAAERAFAHLWAAAEAVSADGRVIVQTLHPDHYAVAAVRARDRDAFYRQELAFREELGYPPFRRLCEVAVTAADGERARGLAARIGASLAGLPGLTVYPAAPTGPAGARRARWRFVIKGPGALPHLLAEPLRPWLERPRRGGGVVEVEMDPVSLG